MPERTIDPAQLASYTAHLRREERSPGTIEKYLRDIRAFAGWLDGQTSFQGTGCRMEGSPAL